MDFRKYSAELVGSFIFFVIGTSRSRRCNASAPGAPNLLVVPWSFGWPARGDLRLRTHLRRALQPGCHHRDGARQANDAHRRGRLHPVADHRGDLRGLSSCRRVSQQAVTDGITAPGGSGRRRLIIEIVATAGFLAVILAASKRAPAIAALRSPDALRASQVGGGDPERRLGQPGTLTRVGHRRRRPVEDLDLHRGADRRRRPWLAGLAPHRRWRGDLSGRAARRGGSRGLIVS